MSRANFIKQQAEAFLAYSDKTLLQSFEQWAESKDFPEREKRAILCEALRKQHKTLKPRNAPYIAQQKHEK